MQNILPLDAWKLLESDSQAYLVDVRTEAEWSCVGCPDLFTIQKNLMKITWGIDDIQFIANLEKLIPNKQCKIIFICKAGGRSAAAANLAIAHGYENCYNFVGGFEMNGWKASGLPSTL